MDTKQTLNLTNGESLTVDSDKVISVSVNYVGYNGNFTITGYLGRDSDGSTGGIWGYGSSGTGYSFSNASLSPNRFASRAITSIYEIGASGETSEYYSLHIIFNSVLPGTLVFSNGKNSYTMTHTGGGHYVHSMYTNDSGHLYSYWSSSHYDGRSVNFSLSLK